VDVYGTVRNGFALPHHMDRELVGRKTRDDIERKVLGALKRAKLLGFAHLEVSGVVEEQYICLAAQTHNPELLC
jgi:hypothetical protein